MLGGAGRGPSVAATPNKGSLTLREVAVDPGISYEGARMLCQGPAGEPMGKRPSLRRLGSHVIDGDGFAGWRVRRVWRQGARTGEIAIGLCAP